MKQVPDGTGISRAPGDMPSWELIAGYRHAWALSELRPPGYLASALASWQESTQAELERRGEWRPEALPPQSV